MCFKEKGKRKPTLKFPSHSATLASHLYHFTYSREATCSSVVRTQKLSRSNASCCISEGSSGAKTAVVGTADCGVNGCRYCMCWLFAENKKNILKSGVLLKSLSNRSNNEVTFYIIVVLKLTHSTPSQRQNVLFGRKKGNFGIFDPAFYLSSFLSAQC